MEDDYIGKTFTTDSVEETFALGEEFGGYLKGGEVIEFVGDLGAGKTSFVRGLVEGMGSEDEVASPTFTISKVYQARDDISIFHFDFYRIQEDPGLVAEELGEASDDPKSVVCIEWAETVRGVLPKDRIVIEVSGDGLNEDRRGFKFSKNIA